MTSSNFTRLAAAALSSFLFVACQTTHGAAKPRADGGSAPSPSESPFPPAGVDHLQMKVMVDFEVFGLGKDTVELAGTVAVHRSGPQGADRKSMSGDLLSAALRGQSKTFGEVVAMQSPLQHSPCQYVCEGPGRYRGHFDINGWFWLPQHDLVIFSALPVRVEGTASAMPPVGQRATITAREIPLHDLRKPAANPIGVLTRASGEIAALVPIEAHLRVPDVKVSDLRAAK